MDNNAKERLKEISKTESSQFDENKYNVKIIKYAEELYEKYGRGYSYYFSLENIKKVYRPIFGICKIFAKYVMLFNPGNYNFTVFGFGFDTYYRKEGFSFLGNVDKAYNDYAKFDIENEIPLIVYNEHALDKGGILITDKYFYFSLRASSKLKDVLTKNEAGKISLSEIKTANIDIKKMTNQADVYINNVNIGGFVTSYTKDSIVINEFLNNFPR